METATATAIATAPAPPSPLAYYLSNSPICITTTSTGPSQRGLFASRDIGPGASLGVFRRAVVGSLDAARRTDTCANCFVWTEGAATGARLYVATGGTTHVSKCGGCQWFRYCSKVCQKEAWNRGHKDECRIFKKLGGKELPKAVVMCMELLSRRKHGRIADDDWDRLCGLQSHMDDFKKNHSYPNIELMARGVSQFSMTYGLFDMDFVAAMYARVLTNALTLITPTLDPLGIVLEPTIGYINHSCDPNAYIMMDGSEISVRTLKPIRADEEVFISYIDTTNPFPRRQRELQDRWFFTCQCIKCQKGGTLDEDLWAIQPDALPREMQRVADALLAQQTEAEDSSNFVGTTQAEIRVAALQGKAFAEHARVQQLHDAGEAVQVIEEAMHFCQQSSLWPIHRQPYAALRDDLIVNLLSNGRYMEAWAHCAKRYKYTHPKHYATPFHPVRVVQQWQMAMLAAYLASSNEDVRMPGANMGLIAMMLVKQVLDAAPLSHGAHSAFTRSVAAKAREMMEALKQGVGNVSRDVMDRELELQRDMLVKMGDESQL